jgi:hypothetical protein
MIFGQHRHPTEYILVKGIAAVRRKVVKCQGGDQGGEISENYA